MTVFIKNIKDSIKITDSFFNSQDCKFINQFTIKNFCEIYPFEEVINNYNEGICMNFHEVPKFFYYLFNLNDINEVSLLEQKPGYILPIHKDRELSERGNYIRYLLFLTEQRSGHIFQYNNNLLKWNAGDLYRITKDEYHGSCNFGYSTKLVVRIDCNERDT